MYFGSIFNNGWGGQDIIIGRRRKAGPKFMGQYPAWVRAFIVFAFAYTIHQHGFAITPNMMVVIKFVQSII